MTSEDGAHLIHCVLICPFLLSAVLVSLFCTVTLLALDVFLLPIEMTLILAPATFVGPLLISARSPFVLVLAAALLTLVATTSMSVPRMFVSPINVSTVVFLAAVLMLLSALLVLALLFLVCQTVVLTLPCPDSSPLLTNALTLNACSCGTCSSAILRMISRTIIVPLILHALVTHFIFKRKMVFLFLSPKMAMFFLRPRFLMPLPDLL